MPTTLWMSQVQTSVTTLTSAATMSDRYADELEEVIAKGEQRIAEQRAQAATYRADAAAHRAAAQELRALLPAAPEADPA